ncbi:hypothetical protein ZWY2020_044169 [Hordeum vulgare]|nr:hypothetical protein ZWY2020_044169 [Hordeum vulgare]
MASPGTRMVFLSMLVVVAGLAVPAVRAVGDARWANHGHHRRAPPVPAAPPSSPGPAPAPAPTGGAAAASPSSGTSAPATSSPAPSPAAESKSAAAAFLPLAWPAVVVGAAAVSAVMIF